MYGDFCTNEKNQISFSRTFKKIKVPNAFSFKINFSCQNKHRFLFCFVLNFEEWSMFIVCEQTSLPELLLVVVCYCWGAGQFLTSCPWLDSFQQGFWNWGIRKVGQIKIRNCIHLNFHSCVYSIFLRENTWCAYLNEIFA